MTNSIKHFGVMGMHWGVKKSREIPTTVSVHRSKGNPFLVKKTKYGQEVSRTRITEDQAKKYVEENKQKKLADAFRKAQNTERIIKVGSALVAAYSVISITSMLMSMSKPVPAVDAAYLDWLKNG